MRKYLHQWGIEGGKKSEQNKTGGGEGGGGVKVSGVRQVHPKQ